MRSSRHHLFSFYLYRQLIRFHRNLPVNPTSNNNFPPNKLSFKKFDPSNSARQDQNVNLNLNFDSLTSWLADNLVPKSTYNFNDHISPKEAFQAPNIKNNVSNENENRKDHIANYKSNNFSKSVENSENYEQEITDIKPRFNKEYSDSYQKSSFFYDNLNDFTNTIQFNESINPKLSLSHDQSTFKLNQNELENKYPISKLKNENLFKNEKIISEFKNDNFSNFSNEDAQNNFQLGHSHFQNQTDDISFFSSKNKILNFESQYHSVQADETTNKESILNDNFNTSEIIKNEDILQNYKSEEELFDNKQILINQKQSYNNNEQQINFGYANSDQLSINETEISSITYPNNSLKNDILDNQHIVSNNSTSLYHTNNLYQNTNNIEVNTSLQDDLSNNSTSQTNNFNNKSKLNIGNILLFDNPPPISPSIFSNNNINSTIQTFLENKPSLQRESREIAVPSSAYSRMAHFGGLFLGLTAGAVAESTRRLFRPKNDSSFSISSLFLSENNVKRMGLALCKMRGAALKLGQMLSIQDEFLPPILKQVLSEIRNAADIMPKSQLYEMLQQELGDNWRSHFSHFDEVPFAAASIGQVHFAKGFDQIPVAIKIQYPGIRESIENDLKNMIWLVKYTNLIPKKMYLDILCEEVKTELISECNYINEAQFMKIFKNLLENDNRYYIPDVHTQLSTQRILTMEYVNGMTMDDVAQHTSQEIRNSVGTRLLDLCLKELFLFKLMNTDPNPANYLYKPNEDKLCLLDFGAGRSYPEHFVDNYFSLVLSATLVDNENVKHFSQLLGFLTGEENEEMVNSHVQSVIKVGEPFRDEGLYDFATSTIVNEIYSLAPTMLKFRLKPPPPEAYTLHRKLAGCYLLCIKLKAQIDAQKIFQNIYEEYQTKQNEIQL